MHAPYPLFQSNQEGLSVGYEEERLSQEDVAPEKTWEDFSSSLIESQFRCYFRMSRECFDMLCTKIKSNVGEGAFKSEQYLSELQSTLAPQNSVPEHQMRSLAWCHFMYTGGIICGEVRLAIILRMLAGGVVHANIGQKLLIC